jgi:hypothetical protein
MLSILYNMSADAYAKLVAHNNTVVQQFKTYKEAQERALAEAYSRLTALKEFCVKEREDMRAVFEQEKQSALALERQALLLEKQSMCDAFEREKQALLLEKQSICDAFEREKRETLTLENEKQTASALALERQSALALERQSALALERQSALALETPSSNEQVISDFMAGFFKAN